MSSFNITIGLVTLIIIVIVGSCVSKAQDAPQDYIKAHNDARSSVGVGPVTWDDQVAAYAQNYADQRVGDCELVHSGGPYGENLAWGYPDLSGTAAVKMWVDEKPDYDYDSNTCSIGKMCLHYTQVVWRDTVRIGCGKARCYSGSSYIVCSYDPPGNYDGQRPY